MEEEGSGLYLISLSDKDYAHILPWYLPSGLSGEFPLG